MKMNEQDVARAADPAVFTVHVKASRRQLSSGGHGHTPLTLVRTDKYAGHKIVMRTSYEIEIDGQSLTRHAHVASPP